MKIWTYPIILIILSLFVISAEECGRYMFLSDLPCTQPSSWKPSNPCESYNITIYNSLNVSIQNLTWEDATPKCIFQFGENITEIGIYYWEGEINSGVITVEQQDNMLSIILLQLFLIAFFIIIGFPHKVGFIKLICWGLAIIELILSVWMVYINQTNGNIQEFLFINSIVMLILGGLFGFISLFTYMRKLMDAEKEQSFKDDGYTKFVFDK